MLILTSALVLDNERLEPTAHLHLLHVDLDMHPFIHGHLLRYRRLCLQSTQPIASVQQHNHDERP